MNSTKWQDCKPRLLQVLALWLGLLALGLCYGAAVSRIGFGFPCVFRSMTGLLCPGCGVTHMALCLLHGDILGAFSANPMVLLLLPVLLILAVRITWRYLVSGQKRLALWENRVIIGMIVLLIGFGLVRNLVFFS